MTEYEVLLPVAGSVIVTVEADSPEEAVDLAHISWGLDDIETLESFNYIVEGNVLHAPYNSPEVEEQ